MLDRGELKLIAVQLQEAESTPLPMELRDVVRSCRKLCIDYALLLVALREADELAEMRSENNRRYVRMNEGLVARNYALTNAMEIYEKARRAAKAS